jgi:dipeptidyl aminopeptidase/acylaminoacyl peptidase
MMRADIRATTHYMEAAALFEAIREPGSGLISDATEICAAPGGMYAVFSAAIVEKFEGVPATRIARIDLRTGSTEVLTGGPNADRSPKYSPDGLQVAFLSDRLSAGDFQLHLLDGDGGLTIAPPILEGCVEYLHWSPDGRRILLGVAGHGADVSGGQGAVSRQQATDSAAIWLPTVEGVEDDSKWRRAWVYDLADHSMRQVSQPETNVWEAAWCGDAALVAVVSDGPGEGLWYEARLQIIDIVSRRCREAYRPKEQLALPTAGPTGKHLVVIEAISSDRGITAGDLILIEPSEESGPPLPGKARRLDTRGVDVSFAEWRSDDVLLLAGHRGFEMVVAMYLLKSSSFIELWASTDISSGAVYASVSGFDDRGNCVLIGEGFTRAPEVAVLRDRRYCAIRSFGTRYAEIASAIGAVEQLTWKAPDGLDIQGWLLKPHGVEPFPLIVNVHGGPVWQWRPMWLGRSRAPLLMLLKRGYAIFLPNPRGSTGRGQGFVRLVVGDLGGAETFDHLSGIDSLVQRGIVEPTRLGVTGTSHGGFMTAWLITQDSRFVAAVPVSPVTNQVTEHLISNIPHFIAKFLGESYNRPNGKYFHRSPIMYAQNCKTPTLSICGALDRCTPPEEAMQFHNALREAGVESVLITYPKEGHGVRQFPAAIDFAARVVAWFEERLGPA